MRGRIVLHLLRSSAAQAQIESSPSDRKFPALAAAAPSRSAACSHISGAPAPAGVLAYPASPTSMACLKRLPFLAPVVAEAATHSLAASARSAVLFWAAVELRVAAEEPARAMPAAQLS